MEEKTTPNKVIAEVLARLGTVKGEEITAATLQELTNNKGDD